MQIPQTPFYKRSAFIYLCIACTALIVTGIAAMFHNNQPGSRIKNLPDQLIVRDIPPGGNKAILTLEDERVITLSEVANGKLADQSGIEVIKVGHGELAYQKGPGARVSVQMGMKNTIATPNGGTYQVRLPDSSLVWLNAGSKLSFPTTFSGLKERRVSLSGEAYFEVFSDELKPFKVVTDKAQIEGSGVHFNISSYPDDVLEKITLFEGSAEVEALGQMVSVASGQQAIINQGTIRLLPIAIDSVLAWKNGIFIFDREPLESIMKKISRWYDVDVSYQNIDKSKLFTATAPSSQNVSKVLKQLELSGGIHFKIEEGRIIVTGL